MFWISTILRIQRIDFFEDFWFFALGAFTSGLGLDAFDSFESCLFITRGTSILGWKYYFEKHYQPSFFILKALKDIWQDFKFLN